MLTVQQPNINELPNINENFKEKKMLKKKREDRKQLCS